MNKTVFRNSMVLVLLLLIPRLSSAAHFFSPLNIYTTQYDNNLINEYTDDGIFLRSIQVSGYEGGSIRGLAYNNGLMYGTVDNGWSSDLSVVAFTADGHVVREYRSTGSISGNISYGKIDFDNSGGFYVGQGNGLMHFDIGVTNSGHRIFNQPVFDVKVLSSGNILIATSYDIYEIDTQGNIIRTIQASDPDNIASATPQIPFRFIEIRGIEYNERTDDLYVTMLGSSASTVTLMRLKGSSGVLQSAESFRYGDDIALLDNGTIIVGSRTQVPGFFSPQLLYMGHLGDDEQMFVTQVPIIQYTFGQHNIYTTHYDNNLINEYTDDGIFLRSIQVSGYEGGSIRGLAYNNGLMYGTVDNGWSSDLSVVAFTADGHVVREYRSTGSISGNISYGKIDFDNSGGFYVGQGNGLMHFDIGVTNSGHRIFNQPVFDVKVLSSGNILIATSYDIYEIDTQGNIIRTIQASDPDNIASATPQIPFRFIEIRGIEYNERTDDLYVTMLGSSASTVTLMRLKGSSGVLQSAESFRYGDDIALLDNGTIIVGSRTQVPGFFSPQLLYMGHLGDDEQMFVTQVSLAPSSTAIWLYWPSIINSFRQKNM